jgi:hypothetical protein
MPYVPSRFTGQVGVHDYHKFLITIVSGLLQDVSFSTCLHMRFQHNSAPPHYSHEVRQWLSENYSGRGNEVQVFWPECSHDFNLLDFFL